MADLSGKVAVVTAAGQGIGKASALRFALAGATVWATDINEITLQALAAENPAIKTMVVNVRSEDSIQALVDQVGRIDVLFNCAGYVHQGNIFDCSAEDWEFSMDINVRSVFRMCKAILPGMVAAGSGVIVNMSSVASSVKGAPNRFVYGASKAAVIGMTKSIAIDFVTKGIRCNVICPGTVETPSLGERINALGDYDTVRAAFISRQPMGRLGTPEEIASAALYLASDDSSFMTGQILVVDGGWSV